MVFFSSKTVSPSLKRALRVWTWSLALLVFILISLGGLVRNAGAGLSCPDWPLCYGKVVPPMDVKIFLEWFHRLIAGSVSTLLLGLNIVFLINRELRKKFSKHAFGALLLVLFQAFLGGMTVLGLLHPKWVSSHLVIGLVFFSTILWLAFRIEFQFGKLFKFAENKLPTQTRRNLATLSVFVFFILFAQILLGGLVSSNYAGLACLDFPTCNGQWFPELTGLVKFQVLHRLGALVVTFSVLYLVVLLFREYKKLDCVLAFFAWVLPVLLLIQVSLGVGSVFMRLPLLMSVAHLAVATLLIAALLGIRFSLKDSERV